ncbi:N-acetylmuramoyl-L-alanine amidase [Paenibacillus sp. SC116]|uniref:N-acetylmuramoyl-L-alanine amidase n=1 Tax=Paenibacillus sp. SC116 TaxID=2968986 RepID=UPI00215A9F6E|nr:N-acetylmuramoyl-L-alanine amidase [Paenibacillus sp. SC116]MCR8844039.1 N-acetylmuramoyl-L-alanine amidase [Paenibacillus sp. SC116]
MVKLVAWDAGHGGKDPGAVANGIKEKDIALQIVSEAARRLEARYEGIRCLLIRSNDVYVSLSERTNKANAAKADLLISVHCNAGGGAGGFESFIYNGIGKGQSTTSNFQHAVHTEIMKRLKPLGINDRGQKRGDLHMCRESNMPAVLTENLFVDVASDAGKLKQDAVLEALIEGHVEGVAAYLKLITTSNKPPKKQQDKPTSMYKPIHIDVNGKPVKSGIEIEGVTYAPVRSLAEQLGAQVVWDGDKVSVITK